MLTKTCSKCLVEKSTTEFYADKTVKCGLRSNCKICVKEKYHQRITKIVHAAPDDGLKTCSKCGEEKHLCEFTRRNKCKDGFNNWCVVCTRSAMNIKLLNKLKAVEYLGGKCSVCGYNTHYAALEFHHKNPKEKENSINTIIGRKFNNIKLELDKCILLCSNCHAIKHAEHRTPPKRRLRITKRKFLFEHFDSKCAHCDCTDIRVMDFHHIDPKEKEFHIGCLDASWERTNKEMNKCVMLCRNCHMELHYK